MGGLGNRMFQYMFGHAVARRLGHARVYNGDMPEWSIPAGHPPMPPETTMWVEGGHVFDIDRIVRDFYVRGSSTLAWRGFAQRLEYYDRETVIPLFGGNHINAPSFGDDHIVINVRADEVLAAVHKNYCPMPLSFFEAVIRTSGRQPVFVGQIHTDNEYTHRLRARFPKARFEPRVSTLHDFETLRRAKHVAVAVSSFSWLACWLSEAAETIHMPIAGFFDPRARPDVNLLPRDDERYRFYLMDFGRWLATPEQFESLFSGMQVTPIPKGGPVPMPRRPASLPP